MVLARFRNDDSGVMWLYKATEIQDLQEIQEA